MHYRLRVLKQEGIRTPFRRRSNFCRCVQGLFRYRFQLFFSKHSKFSTRIPKHLNKWIRPPDRILNKLCFNRHLILCDDYKAKIYCFWKFNYWVCFIVLPALYIIVSNHSSSHQTKNCQLPLRISENDETLCCPSLRKSLIFSTG